MGSDDVVCPDYAKNAANAPNYSNHKPYTEKYRVVDMLLIGEVSKAPKHAKMFQKKTV